MLNEKKLLVRYGKKLVEEGLTKGTGGNLSIYNPDKNLIAITPSGLNYYETNIEDIVVADLDGNIIYGHRKPSSELPMHIEVYKQRNDILALVHTHSVFSTVIATLNEPLPACNYLLAHVGPRVNCAKYASFGSLELAKNAVEAMGDNYAVLLANHGLLTAGISMEEAFSRAVTVEHVAEIYYRTRSIGKPKILDDKEMDYMMEKFKTYGK